MLVRLFKARVWRTSLTDTDKYSLRPSFFSFNGKQKCIAKGEIMEKEEEILLSGLEMTFWNQEYWALFNYIYDDDELYIYTRIYTHTSELSFSLLLISSLPGTQLLGASHQNPLQVYQYSQKFFVYLLHFWILLYCQSGIAREYNREEAYNLNYNHCKKSKKQKSNIFCIFHLNCKYWIPINL